MRRGPIVAVMVLTAACTSGTGGVATNSTVATTSTMSQNTTVPTASTSTTLTTTTTTTTTAPTTTVPGDVDLTHPDTPAPPVDLHADTFEELARVWSDIDDYLVWLDAHPTVNPSAVALVLEAGSPAYESKVSLMAQLVADQQRIVGRRALGDLTAFSCCPQPQPEIDRGVITVGIQSRSDTPAARAIDSEGRVVVELPGWEVMTWLVTFRRGEDGAWRVVSFQS